jgi:hypothetical protein
VESDDEVQAVRRETTGIQMSNDISRQVTAGMRRGTGRVFCQYCRIDKPADEIAWLKPRACCLKCQRRGTRRSADR